MSIRVHLIIKFNNEIRAGAAPAGISLADEYQISQLNTLWSDILTSASLQVPGPYHRLRGPTVPWHPRSLFERRQSRYPDQPPFIPGRLCKSEVRIAARWGRHVSVNIMNHLSVQRMPSAFIIDGIRSVAKAQNIIVNAPRRSFNITSLPTEIFETIVFYSAELHISMLAQTTTAAHPGDQWCY